MEVLGTLVRATLDNTNRISNLATDLNRYVKATGMYILLGFGCLYLVNKHIKKQDIIISNLESKVEQLKKQ